MLEDAIYRCPQVNSYLTCRGGGSHVVSIIGHGTLPHCIYMQAANPSLATQIGRGHGL